MEKVRRGEKKKKRDEVEQTRTRNIGNIAKGSFGQATKDRFRGL
jgi:hypothetical protein